MGFIGIDRGIQQHWIYQDAEYFKVWFEMLLRARYSKEPHYELVDGKIIEVNYGHFIFGRIKWSQRLKISEQRLRTLLIKLKKDKMIEVISKHNKFTLYKIVNYEKFNQQTNQQPNQLQQGFSEDANQQNNLQLTSSQPAANQQPTTKEQGSKKVNKENKEVIKILYGDFIQMTPKQYESLLRDLGEAVTQKYILSIDDWFAQDNSRLKKYSDHARMIRTWKRNDDLEPLSTTRNHKGRPSSFTKLQQMYAKAQEDERIAANGSY